MTISKIRCGVLTAGMVVAGLAVGPALADKSDDTLRVAFAEDIINLDYNFTTKREYLIISTLIDETLLSIDAKSGAYGSALAETWEQVDPVTLDVTLWGDVQFHDGSPLTAGDVVYTYNAVADPASGSQSGARISGWLDRAEALDERTVRFHMKKQYPLALRDMALRVPVRKAGTYGEGAAFDPNAASEAPVGLGPYRVKAFEPGAELALERFDGYYGDGPKGDPQIGTIVVRSLPDLGTQQAELISGGIDWMYYVPRDIAESVGAMPSVKHVSGPDQRIAFLILDAAGVAEPDGPLTELKVRQALNHAIDKAAIADALIGGAARPIAAACHPSQSGCDEDVIQYSHDPGKARALLAKAGYPEGFPLELWAYRDKPVGEAIVANLRGVGVDTTLRQVKLASLNQARAARDITAYFGTWTADTAAPISVHFAADSDRNLSGDADLAEMIVAADTTLDDTERTKLLSGAYRRISEQAYWVHLFSYSVNYLMDPELEMPTDPDGFPRLYNANWVN